MVTTSVIQRTATEQQSERYAEQAAVRKVEEVMISGLVHMHTVQTGAFTHHSYLNSQKRPPGTQPRESREERSKNMTQPKVIYVLGKPFVQATTHTVNVYHHAVFKNCD